MKNNAYVFPGIALGVIATGTHHIPDEMFLIAAQSVADHVSDEDIAKGSLYPPLSSVQQVSFDIAVGLTKYAYAKGKWLFYKKSFSFLVFFQLNKNFFFF